MTIHFACTCGRPFSVRNRRAGSTALCPDCGRDVLVPEKPRKSTRRAREEVRRRRSYHEADEDLLGGVSKEDYADAGFADMQDRPGRAGEAGALAADPDNPNDSIVGGLSAEEWAVSGFPEARGAQRQAQSSGAREQHDSWALGRKDVSFESAPSGRRRRLFRLALLLAMLFGIIVAVPSSLANLRRLVQGEARTNEAVALNDLGVGLEAANRMPEAIAAFEDAVRHEPELFEAHYNLGNALDATRRHADALTAFRTAVRLRPNHAGASFGLGAALFNTMQYPDAEQELRRALTLDAAHAEAHLYLSYALYRQNRAAEAWAALQVARELGAHFSLDYARRVKAALDATGAAAR